MLHAELWTDTYAPLYWATSSPSTNTLSFDSSSSARASLRASLTAISLTPLGVAYLLLDTIVGIEIVGCKTDRVGVMKGGRRREAGRRSREATMAKTVGNLTKKENDEKCRDCCYKTMMLCSLDVRRSLTSFIGESWEENHRR